ncbi:hypothetical protein F4779DRAFT_3853 [Xylariaceae sp. FL0662B]|nr:hypothetical protein F4779DRAFT_3853 [Xylariaceae sp. FL0662B]
MARTQFTNFSTHTASSGGSRRSADSYDSRSTAPTSLYDSPRPSTKGSGSGCGSGCGSRAPRFPSAYYEEDLSPVTSLYPRSSVDTYSSQASSDESDDMEIEESLDYSDIPPLPIYRHEIEDINVRPSTPEDFAALFPSMDRLTIRHDDFTPDGNMNLRVDTIVSGRRRKTIQLFHLRMYDLNKREFSLRRYCRDSGREVCNSKRKFIESPGVTRRASQRSMTNAMKNFAKMPQLTRTPTGGSMFSARSRPGTSSSAAAADDEFTDTLARAVSADKKQKAPPLATDTIKLEFSNYARVDVRRRGNKGSKRYEFEWWGHNYSWKRVSDKLTGSVSFHLLKDGNINAPVAHIVPETRSPNQVAIDERAGGWVPPCHMWISDESILDAVTDVADVIVSTGLISLVDNCVKERWQTKKIHRIGLPLTSKTMDVEVLSPRAFVQHMFARRNSQPRSSPLRLQRPVTVY